MDKMMPGGAEREHHCSNQCLLLFYLSDLKLEKVKSKFYIFC